ncbi:undecaprenyldiphospho-muramoylpentapeptide beta-N-acetylglucosaminyltransferase [Desulfotomaculum copahuensis]|uniref:UDP-N-acetylglucosamine--N-acetylmuramyl-(pentapeptide) pyrophosphoryl-undecaprenol N-acetylglucosamine transferase n=1 Tax=Desulfotomaculum copahuensis TaxID=1838280 RepID=A0A1B7LET9_9FIRM|nr:undecaprenyldiphospho-muramoylpentapeptide beta-N-acetylglucosaminyltransferase [Desulfotomaculum copahuensis]OAT81809.1 undecaprenyldiphospho-muramoylpentapeptide beta-N-acetylglucosaminyltransferase [Desulfotomaculum copahuensis]
MRFVVTGGGTGGHIYPALAIARGLQDKYPGAEILYVGKTGGLEAGLAARAGLPFQSIPLAGLQRRLAVRNVTAVWQAARGVVRARRILAGFGPDAVVGTGGYVCGPVVLAAALTGIPTLIHEQNALPGVTNRLLSRFVSRVAVTFADAVRYFPRRDRVVLTGLPVRPEILAFSREEARRTLGLPVTGKLVLCFGGSQGARTINGAMAGVLPRFAGRPGVCFIHVTGPAQYDSFMAALSRSGLRAPQSGNISIIPYLYEMPAALAAADLVICRAGAATIAELTVAGLPSVLVPYPHATGNHQEFNARALERQGAAIVIRDAELSGSVLATEVEQLLADERRLQAMAGASKKMGRPGALADITGLIDQLLS